VHCLITEAGPYGNMQSYEHCKLSGLPDLNHSDASVVDRLVQWMQWTEREFRPDGIRFDACHNSLEVRERQRVRARAPVRACVCVCEMGGGGCLRHVAHVAWPQQCRRSTLLPPPTHTHAHAHARGGTGCRQGDQPEARRVHSRRDADGRPL
jgi:glycosidase